jgi:hypothetical protein
MANHAAGVQGRRSFLRRLLAVPAALAGATARLGAQEVDPRRTTIGRFHVAGFRYYRGPELVGGIQAGEALRLVAEPENPYDAGAVRIEYRGVMLGYVPRRDNGAISHLLRDGAPVAGRAVEVRPEEEPWRMLRVEAELRWG